MTEEQKATVIYLTKGTLSGELFYDSGIKSTVIYLTKGTLSGELFCD